MKIDIVGSILPYLCDRCEGRQILRKVFPGEIDQKSGILDSLSPTLSVYVRKGEPSTVQLSSKNVNYKIGKIYLYDDDQVGHIYGHFYCKQILQPKDAQFGGDKRFHIYKPK